MVNPFEGVPTWYFYALALLSLWGAVTLAGSCVGAVYWAATSYEIVSIEESEADR
jgi:hypothetical protein